MPSGRVVSITVPMIDSSPYRFTGITPPSQRTNNGAVYDESLIVSPNSLLDFGSVLCSMPLPAGTKPNTKLFSFLSVTIWWDTRLLTSLEISGVMPNFSALLPGGKPQYTPTPIDIS